MQTIDDMRARWNPRAQWVRLGVLSAGVFAPLVARWNELRAAERARTMREEAEARLKGFGAVTPWRRRDVQERIAAIASKTGDKSLGARRVSATIWLVGVGVGLAAAGAGTYLLVRRRLARSAEEPMLDLPLTSPNGHGRATATSQPAGATAPATTSTAAPSAPTAPTAPTAPRASAAPPAAAASPAHAPAHPASDQTVNANAATTATGAESAFEELRAARTSHGPLPERVVDTSGRLEGGGSSLLPDGETAGVVNPAQADFIGNVKTMVYHDATDDNLPIEENRVYFASEEEARTAGYRRDKEDVPATEAEVHGHAVE